MAKDGERETAYVRKVQVGTRRYVERLLKENETLRTLLLKTESEKLALDEKVLTIQAQLSRHEIEQVSLRRKMAEIEVNNQRFTKEYLEIEHQNANLANLYVTSYRLHGTLERDEVLSVIQEILINLVGSEEVAVFELDEDGEALTLASSFGIDEERYRSVAVGSDVIGKVAETGEAFFGNEDPEDDAVTACIALKVEDKVTGVITVFGLLPQKSGLEAVWTTSCSSFWVRTRRWRSIPPVSPRNCATRSRSVDDARGATARIGRVRGRGGRSEKVLLAPGEALCFHRASHGDDDLGLVRGRVPLG